MEAPLARAGVLALLVAGCAAPAVAPVAPPPSAAAPSVAPSVAPSIAPSVAPSSKRGFPVAGPWLSYYADADGMGDLDAVAARYRIINIDADPGAGNFTQAQIQRLRGRDNRVLSYLNLGAVEDFRTYWSQVPPAAVLGSYPGYADERWMDPAHPAWRKLLLDTIVPALVAQGVDGFFFDNLEVLSHPSTPAASRQAGLDLVGELRTRYPDLLFVLQNGTGPVTREGKLTDGRTFASLLDGVSHESVFTQPSDTEDASEATYTFEVDEEALADMRAWKTLGLPLLLAISEYVNGYDRPADAARARGLGEAEGFTVFVSDRSGGQQEVPPAGY